MNLQDYKNAPSGKGPLAAQWNDKPHRLVYDLVNELEKYTKLTWTKTVPENEGWYWVKYKDKHNKFIYRPAMIFHFKDCVTIQTAGNDFFIVKDGEVYYSGKHEKGFRFGPPIPIPE